MILSIIENLCKELKITENAFVVGHVGRFNIAKNHATIIKVAVKMCLEDPNIYFVFCGNKVKQGLIYEVKRHGLENQIILLGYRKDVIKVLNTLDCFYFPSVTEGQPNALIEAMVAGIPFVASDISPIIETIPKKLSQCLVPALDFDLAINRILEIKNNPEIKNQITCSDWAQNKFDSNLQFNKFLEKM